jgi:hypothetical protein
MLPFVGPLFLLIPIQAVSETSPFYLDIRLPQSGRLEYVEGLIRKYELDLPEEQLHNLQRAFASDGNWLPREEAITGTVQFYDPDARKIQTAQFWTMPDQAAFDDFVVAELERRGTDAIADGLGSSKVHFEKTPAIDGKWQLEVWAMYRDGVCVQGISKSIHAIKTRRIKEWLKGAKGKRTYVRVQVDAIPVELREAVLKRMRTQSDTRLQRRDGEPSLDYSVRRTIGDESFRSLESAVRQLRSISYSTTRPGVENGDWSIDIAVETKPNTRVRELLGQLVVRRPSLSVSDSEETTAEAQVNLKVPPDLKKIASRLIRNFPDDRNPRALADVIETVAAGRLEAAIAVPADETIPAVIGAVRFAGQRDMLTRLFGEDSLLDGQFTSSLGKLLELDELDLYQLAVRIDDGLLGATVAEKPQDVPTDLLATDIKRQPAPLVQFRIDLAKWGQRGTEGTPSNDVLRKIESLSDRYQRWSRVRAIRRKVMTSDMPANHKSGMVDVLSRNSKIPKRLSADFESVAHKTTEEGDWSASGELSFRNGTLRLQATIGRDLYGLYRVRGLLAAARALRSME